MLPIIILKRDRAYPPKVNKFTETFWQGLPQGVFLTTQCQSCDHLTFPPKPHCPKCGHRKIKWQELKGTGTLYSMTRIHAAATPFAADTPISVAIIDLDEGIRLVAPLLEEHLAPQLDDKIELVVTKYNDGYLFAARPQTSERKTT